MRWLFLKFSPTDGALLELFLLKMMFHYVLDPYKITTYTSEKSRNRQNIHYFVCSVRIPWTNLQTIIWTYAASQNIGITFCLWDICQVANVLKQFGLGQFKILFSLPWSRVLNKILTV